MGKQKSVEDMDNGELHIRFWNAQKITGDKETQEEIEEELNRRGWVRTQESERHNPTWTHYESKRRK